MKRDVAVLGAGIVGVCVALHVQSRGRSVVLVDRRGAAEETSFGNAGLIQREGVYPYGFPHDFGALLRYGLNRTIDAHYHLSALPELAPFLWKYWKHSRRRRHAQIARVYSRLIEHCVAEHEGLVAESDAQALVQRVAHQPKGLEVEAQVVFRAEQRDEIGTDAYWGGVVYTRHCSVDPARYHRGLQERALAAGVQLLPRCLVTRIEKDGDGFRVVTARGTTRARDVVVQIEVGVALFLGHLLRQGRLAALARPVDQDDGTVAERFDHPAFDESRQEFARGHLG